MSKSVGSFEDTINEKILGNKSAEDRLIEIVELINDPNKWMRNLEDPKNEQNIRDIEENSKSFLGTNLWAGEIEENIKFLEENIDINGETVKQAAQRTYETILEEEPANAERFRQSIYFDLDEESAIKQRVNELLTNYQELGLDEEEALKEAFAVVNQTEYRLEKTEELEQNEIIDLNESWWAEQQLADEILSRLDGTAKAFFEYARMDREKRPEGVHTNFDIDAETADGYDPLVSIIEEADILKEEYSELGNLDIPTIYKEASGNSEEGRLIDQELGIPELIQRVGISHRFGLEDKEEYSELARQYINGAIEEVEESRQDTQEYMSSARKLLEKAENLPRVNKEGVTGEEFDDVKSEVENYDEYLGDRLDLLITLSEETGEMRTQEESYEGSEY